MLGTEAIRCVALDLDGTTLNSQGKLSERTRQAIRAALERRIHVIVASGRPVSSLPEGWNPRDPVRSHLQRSCGERS